MPLRAADWRAVSPAGGCRPGLGRLALVLALLATAILPTRSAAQGSAPRMPSHVWLDAAGRPLPFQTDEELSEFLQTASVASQERVPAGVNRPQRLLLEKGGTRAHAAFRTADVRRRDVRIGDRFYFDFRDSYRHECAAYALARWLGLMSVPPAVPRRIDSQDGSVQMWVEQALDEEAGEFSPPNVRAWVAQVWDKDLFDNLVLNVDRNAGNILVCREYHLLLIDHTRAFQPIPELLDPGRIVRVNGVVWDQLKSLTDDGLRGLVGEYLDGPQMSALQRRRDLLVAHVEGLIAERGERAVLY